MKVYLKKKLTIMTMCIGMGFLGACGKVSERTPEEQWRYFCQTYQGAAFNIMLDRQNGLEKEKVLAHAKKTKTGKESNSKQHEMIVMLVDEAYQVPKYSLQKDIDNAKDSFKQGKYERCMSTPHSS